MFKGEARRLISKVMVLVALVTCLFLSTGKSSAADDCCCEDCYSDYLNCQYWHGANCEEDYNNCANGCNDEAGPDGPQCPLMQ